MRSLKHSLAEYAQAILEGIGENVNVQTHARTREEWATAIATHLLEPSVVENILARLSSRALDALTFLQRATHPIAWATFLRRYGPVRDLGPEALLRERPWRHPLSPAEELLYHGLIFHAFRKVRGQPVEVVYIPPEIQLLLPPVPEPDAWNLPTFPAPDTAYRAWNTFLNDLIILLSHIFNFSLTVDWEGYPLRGELAQLGQKFYIPLAPTELLHPPPRVQLLFHHARVLGHIYQEGDQLRIRARSLNRWLRASPVYQRLTLWRAWVESPRWNDLCHIPQLECVNTGEEIPSPDARRRFLDYLTHLKKDTWYRVEDVVETMYKEDPDFLRVHGNYDLWLIRRREDATPLRGFEHWRDVEGRLITFYLLGPMYWLDAIALDEGKAHFTLTAAGYGWLRGRSEPARQKRPPLRVGEDFRVHLPLNAWASDHFRVSRFAEWEGSRPHYTYRIAKRGLQRAYNQGISPRRIVAFLREATQGHLPRHVERAILNWRPTPSKEDGHAHLS